MSRLLSMDMSEEHNERIDDLNEFTGLLGIAGDFWAHHLSGQTDISVGQNLGDLGGSIGSLSLVTNVDVHA